MSAKLSCTRTEVSGGATGAVLIDAERRPTLCPPIKDDDAVISSATLAAFTLRLPKNLIIWRNAELTSSKLVREGSQMDLVDRSWFWNVRVAVKLFDGGALTEE